MAYLAAVGKVTHIRRLLFSYYRGHVEVDWSDIGWVFADGSPKPPVYILDGDRLTLDEYLADPRHKADVYLAGP